MKPYQGSTMPCENCGTEFNCVMASCGTGTTYCVYKCPQCKHVHVIKRDYNPIDMLQKKEDNEDHSRRS